MKLTLETGGWRFRADDANAQSIAVAFDFDGRQPNHFGAPRGSRKALELGGFVGRTKRGGSCNVDVLQLTPHCNGTHTETISHIVNEEIWVGHALPAPLMPALLVTVPVTSARETKDTYRPPLDDADFVICADSLRRAVDRFKLKKPAAMVIRTRPNPEAKKTRAYGSGDPPAFLTVEAMHFVVELGCRHLLVDLPSVDRMYDDGLLTNHHLFWNVPEKSHSMGEASWQDKTITEMVFVGDSLVDGPHVLNLQAPAFCSDAAPSRPVMIPASMERIDNK